MAVERLLRREIVGRAQDVLVEFASEDVVVVVEKAGQPHVEDLDAAVARHQDVARLDVAMHQARALGVVEADRRLANVMAGTQDAQRPALLDDVLQAGAVDVLHDKEVQVLILVDVVGVDDVGMVDGGDGAGLAIEAAEGGLVLRLGGRQDLDCPHAAHQLVFAQEHGCPCRPSRAFRGPCTCRW